MIEIKTPRKREYFVSLSKNLYQVVVKFQDCLERQSGSFVAGAACYLVAAESMRVVLAVYTYQPKSLPAEIHAVHCLP